MKRITIAIVGATGLVGRNFLRLIENEKDNNYNLELFASEKSVGKTMLINGIPYKINPVKKGCFKQCNFVFLFTNADVSKLIAIQAKREGSIVIDNSSYFRMRKNVPLVIPEINLNTALNKKIIANPNCSTIIAALPLYALLKKYPIKEIQFTTFQSVSGSGMNGIKALKDSLSDVPNDFYPVNIAKTCLPCIGKMLKNGFSEEENKMINETKKIFNDYGLKINATCVRVPIENCHAINVFVKFKRNFKLKNVVKRLKAQTGVTVLDDFPPNNLPTNYLALENTQVFVGRIRHAVGSDNALLFYVVGDNLLRGSSYNAYEIMRNILKENDSL